MDNSASTNITQYGDSTKAAQLPLYLSTHSEIPLAIIHEVAVAWMVAGMVFNGVLIYYLLAAKKYRSPVFMLVLFLATADFVLCLSEACLAGFVWPVYLLPKSTWILCKFVYYIVDVSGSSSPYYLVFFAGLRFYQLCFPLRARARVTSSFVRNWCLVIMLIEIAAWTPFLFSFNLIDVNYDGRRAVVCDYTGHLVKLKGIAFLVVNSCIPAISIPVLHLLKYIGVARTKHSIEGQQERKNTDIRALMIIIAMFYICWIPMNINAMVSKYMPNHGAYQDRLRLVLLYVNSSSNVLNPLVYCLAASSVRADIAKLLCRRTAHTSK